MTKLLVSVRNADEAQTAIAAGADLIDIKDPAKGSLGAPSVPVVAQIVQRVAGRTPVSVACGELSEQQPIRPLSADGQVQYVKVGLAGAARDRHWHRRWSAAIRPLSHRTNAVAVVYADWRHVDAPSPETVLRRALQLNCRVLLIDTCDKRRGDLLTHWTRGQLASFLDGIRDAGLLAAVAGSVSESLLETILPLLPDYVAVRGAVSRPHRDGALDGALVRRFVERLQR